MRSLRLIALFAGKDLRILLRSKATLMVIFLPGIVLYTIFTSIFGGPAGPARPFRVAVIDEDKTPASKLFIESLEATHMQVVRNENDDPEGKPLTRESAKDAIKRRGNWRVALVIPKGYGHSPNMLTNGPDHHGVIMYFDELEPTESQIAGGLVQMAAGRQVFTSMFGGGGTTSKPGSTDKDERILVKIDRQSIRVHRMKNAAKHAFLAGIVPMFLLFSAAGAARSVLESCKSGEVRRVLAAPVHSSHWMLGNLLYMLVIALTQCYAMYLFAWLAFGVAIWQIAGGLFVLTLCTALATIGFGLFLGGLCRNPEQLDAVGTMVILAMSAIGGSMVPRHIMPEWMQRMGLFTINGWSFDGFMSVLAFEGFAGLAPPCAVLLSVAAVTSCIGIWLMSSRLRQ